jgi:hypothetical protein
LGGIQKSVCQTEYRNDREALRPMKHPTSGARHYQNHKSTIQNDYGVNLRLETWEVGTNRFVLEQAGRRGALVPNEAELLVPLASGSVYDERNPPMGEFRRVSKPFKLSCCLCREFLP